MKKRTVSRAKYRKDISEASQYAIKLNKKSFEKADIIRNSKLYKAKIAMDSLTVYRGILKDKTISKFYTIISQVEKESIDFCFAVNSYCDFYYHLTGKKEAVSLKDHINNCIIYNENAFTACIELGKHFNEKDAMWLAVKNDLRCLEIASSISAEDIKAYLLSKYRGHELWKETIISLPVWDSNTLTEKVITIDFQDKNSTSHRVDCVNNLVEFLRHAGTGQFAKFKGFIWENSGQKHHLRGVDTPDPVRLTQLVGYEQERNKVIENTLMFLKGHKANNVLLYGDRGTGKSSTVKALLNEYGNVGLRIIELPRAFLTDLGEIIRIVKNKPQRFIIFIDDLVFNDNAENYTALKAVLEGGLETRPSNVVIYATSNRRHLVKEKFMEIAGLASGSHLDEIRAKDTIEEKLSLADRFGINVTFSSPDQNKYLMIVEELAKNRGIDIDIEKLQREALKWEKWNNGRSPRTACQFVDWLEGVLKA